MANQKKSTNRAGQVKMDVAIVLSTSRVTLETLLNCSEGSIIEMNKRAGEVVDVEVNGTPFAKGEVVTVAEHFGVRITEKL
jgi:flagellar motor switch protein FliN/FliY